MQKIERFIGDYAFLSNMHLCRVQIWGEEYPSSEHAFQAAKTEDPAEQHKIRTAKTPYAAKALGKKVRLRANWNSQRVDFMTDILRAKFANPELRERLLATGTAELVEGNTWNDTFWGVCNGRGSNELGRALMRVRDEVRQ